MNSLITEFKQTLMKRGLEFFGRYYSSYRGTCYANNDPDQLGRIRVTCPQLYGEDCPDIWAWPRGLPAGRGHGLFWVPQPGDPVYITCEGGDSNFPLFEHGWWVRDGVPSTARKATPTTYLLQTPGGHLLEFDDAAGTVHLRHKSGHRIDITPEGIRIAGAGGRTMGQILKSQFGQLATLTVGTPLGPSTPPLNAALIVQFMEELAVFLL